MQFQDFIEKLTHKDLQGLLWECQLPCDKIAWETTHTSHLENDPVEHYCEP